MNLIFSSVSIAHAGVGVVGGEKSFMFSNFTDQKIYLLTQFPLYTENCQYGVDLAKQLATSLISVLGSCGSVRISFSDRTPQKV